MSGFFFSDTDFHPSLLGVPMHSSSGGPSAL